MPSVNEAYLNFYYEKTSVINGIYENCFTITSLIDNNRISFNRSDYSLPDYPNIQYSLDGGMSWNNLSSDLICELDTGESVMLKGTNTTLNGYYFRSSGEFNVSGNPLSMINPTTFNSITTLPVANIFKGLFSGSEVVDASKLQLPATTLTANCYDNMFSLCISLEKAPKLPATTLAQSCYSNMFNGCISLLTAPDLPATTMAQYCYNNMFNSCTSLTAAPTLPATTMAAHCYEGMFIDCDSLVVPPQLPATDLAPYCYAGMFMNCSSLETAPSLPATILDTNCYYRMFKDCTSLIQAPLLPAQSLESGCYQEMFKGCTSLNYIKILATSRPQNALTDWVENVAPTGVFIKDPSATYPIDSNSGVPIGWTVHNAGEDEPTECTLTLVVDPAGYGTVSGGGTYLSDTRITVRAFPDTGCTFIGWYNGSTLLSENQVYTFTIEGNTTLTAKFIFTPAYYTVSLLQEPEIGATLTGAGTYADASSVTVTAGAVTGYTFIGWSNNGNIVNTSSVWTFNISGDIILTAVYQETTIVTYYTVTLNQDPNVGAALTGAGTYVSGTYVTISAPSVSGYTFVAWQEDSQVVSTNSSFTVELLDNHVYTAVYQSSTPTTYYTITLTQDPYCGATLTGAGQYVQNGIATITASEVANYSFAGWRLNEQIVSTRRSYTFTVTSNATYVAVYNYTPVVTYYTVTLNKNINAGTVTGAGSYEAGSYVTVGAAPGDNATFIRWIKNGVTYTTSPIVSFTITENVELTAEFAIDYSHTYLTIESTEDDNAVVVYNWRGNNSSNRNITFEYRVNNNSWLTKTQSLYGDVLVTLNAGDVINFRNASRQTASTDGCTITTRKNAIIYGNMMSLLPAHIDWVNTTNSYYYGTNNTNYESTDMRFRFGLTLTATPVPKGITDASNLLLPATTLSDGCYNQMFGGCRTLIAAPVLPATTLAESCYFDMFESCASLVTPPALPATTLADYCYTGMFEGCTSLTSTPTLSATTMTTSCYSAMFRGCTSLASVPSDLLPSTSLAYACYRYMFQGCTSLVTPPALPAPYSMEQFCYAEMFKGCTSLTTAPVLGCWIMAEDCYYCMFQDCTSLTTVPELPATTLAPMCYNCMFSGCTSLTTVYQLSATTLANGCYTLMFENCTSLASVPYNMLPATIMVEDCYNGMFSGCTSLTSAPALPSTDLWNSCYANMFEGCTSLTQAPTLSATRMYYRCYANMFNGCTSLTGSPALPATTLANNCYEYMFSGCTSLIAPPSLPAGILYDYCYTYMFDNCVSLSSPMTLIANDIPPHAYEGMFYNCISLNNVTCLAQQRINTNYSTKNWLYGVASTGTFTREYNQTWPSGPDGIPTNWTVQNVS